MMQIVCDRCGTVIANENRDRSVTILTYRFGIDGQTNALARQDVCPDCSAALGRFMTAPTRQPSA
jgi:hypothetical protein